MPESFEEQADVIWTHIGTLLRAANMSFADIVSLRTYLADPKYDEANVRMRVKYLGTHATSSTVICCQLLPSYHAFYHLPLLVCHHSSRIKYTVDASSVSFCPQSPIYILQFFTSDLFLALVSYHTSS